MRSLDGKVAIITGAASGIGEAAAELFIDEGARVVVADASGREEETAGRLGPNAMSIHVDVSVAGEVHAMVQHALDAFDGIDILCNNAGIEGSGKEITDTPDDEFDHIIAVDLTSVFLGMKYAVPAMIERGGGSIINISSMAGLVGFPGIGPYAAAKAGVIQLTRVAALEFGSRNIRVNAICPGAVLTPMMRAFRDREPERAAHVVAQQPLARFATPREVAQLTRFLASDASASITGAALPIDGGYSAQ